MKPGTPPLQSSRLLDQLRERIRYMHYSLSTEKVYAYWVRFFIRWSAQGGHMRHPRDIDAPGVEAFLTMLATERKVSASTHNQALSALLFLYREVLNIDLPWLNDINRPAQKRRIPCVLTKDEVAGMFAYLEGPASLVTRLLYGTGMRLMEGMRLRIKDDKVLAVHAKHLADFAVGEAASSSRAGRSLSVKSARARCSRERTVPTAQLRASAAST